MGEKVNSNSKRIALRSPLSALRSPLSLFTPALRSRSGFLLFPFDAEQFEFKNQSGISRDFRSGRTVAISKCRRNKKFPLASDLHHHQCFGPAVDELIHWVLGRFAFFDGAVENSS